MLISKLKLAATVILVIAAAGLGAGQLLFGTEQKKPPPGFVPQPVPQPVSKTIGFRSGPVVEERPNPFADVAFNFKPVLTLTPAVKSDPGIAGFSFTHDTRSSLAFTFRVTQPDKDGKVALTEQEGKLADVKDGIPLSPPVFLDRAGEILVDGVLHSVRKTANTAAVHVTVSTLATVERVNIDGVLPVRDVRVTIDAQPAKLDDLKPGMPMSLRLAKVTDHAVSLEIRAGKGAVTFQRAADAAEPLTHYSKSGPIGQLFRAFKDDPRLKKVGVAGLGNGSLAAYSEPGQEWTFFEIDESVKKTAEDPKRFTFLRDAKGKVRIELGDARLRLQGSKETFGLLVLDAGTSDAVPVHLLTREAVALYRERLVADGILVFHISQRDIDLEPVVASLAADAKCVAYARNHAPSAKEKKLGITASHWLVMARQEEHLAPLVKTGSWQPARTKAGSKVWTDDYSNLLEALRKKGDD